MKLISISVLIILVFLTGCGSDNSGSDHSNEYLSDKLKLELVNIVGEKKHFIIPKRYYETVGADEYHRIISRDSNLQLVFRLVLSDGSDVNDDTRRIFSALTCNREKFLKPDEEGFVYLKLSNPLTKMTKVHMSCEYQNTPDKLRLEGRTKDVKIILHPESPIDDIFLDLDKLGYSPYNTYVGKGYNREVNDRIGFMKGRDKFDLGFIDTDQSGPHFFWNEQGLTNAVINISSCYPGTDKTKDRMLEFSSIISKLILVDEVEISKVLLSLELYDEIKLKGYKVKLTKHRLISTPYCLLKVYK